MLKQEKKIVRAPAGSLWKTIYKTAEQKQLSFWGWTNINIGNTSLFGKLLKIDNSVSVHHRTNIKVLSTELVYKLVNGLSPKLINDCLKRGTLFYPWLVNKVLYDTESLSHLGPKIWKIMLIDMKNQLHWKSIKLVSIWGQHWHLIG